jgi:opacity protein-like surface antigen
MNLRLALVSAACLTAALARAQPVAGPYVSLAAGANVPYPVNYNYAAVQDFGDAPYAGPTGKFLFRPSYAGAVAFGYGFGDGLRVELGGDFLRATVHKDDKATFGDYAGLYPRQSQTNGGTNTYGPMVNLLYDFTAGLPLYPYLGAGVGYQWMKLSRRIDDNDGFYDTIEGTQGSFAYDVIAGLAYKVPGAKGVTLTLQYSFMQLVESRNYATSFPAVGGPYDGPNRFGQDAAHLFVFGVRYQLSGR